MGALPHYCYKEGRRGVSATCRMCRVEREGGRKPVPSCARPVGNGMGVWTETPRVQKVREGVRERRLENHPLDCPICDQGGECDLQEQTVEYGSESSRIRERKRGVEDKRREGPVKRVMTRCIHCTRCVRYGKQVGKRGRGRRGRGKETEIGRYTPKGKRSSGRAGNRVDRCPVGARTAEEGKYTVRAWERKREESVDRRDSVGLPRALKYAGGERKRVRPKRGKRGERLGDKTRYGYDGRENGRRREVQRKAEGVDPSKKGEWKRQVKGAWEKVEKRAPQGERRKEGRGYFAMRRKKQRMQEKKEKQAKRWMKGKGYTRERTQLSRSAREAGKAEEAGRSKRVMEGRKGVLGEERRRRVGTGVDRERREERKREELKKSSSERLEKSEAKRKREGLGRGKRGERRRHAGETVVKRPLRQEKKGKGKERRRRGSNREYERPVRGRERSRGGGYGLGGEAEGRKGVGVVRGTKRRERKRQESRRRKGEGSVHVRRGAGRWGREDGKGWVKRKGKREKGREERGELESGVSVRQHRTNTQGRRERGI